MPFFAQPLVSGITQISGRPVKIDFVNDNDDVVPYADATKTRICYQDGGRELMYFPHGNYKVKA